MRKNLITLTVLSISLSAMLGLGFSRACKQRGSWRAWHRCGPMRGHGGWVSGSPMRSSVDSFYMSSRAGSTVTDFLGQWVGDYSNEFVHPRMAYIFLPNHINGEN